MVGQAIGNSSQLLQALQSPLGRAQSRPFCEAYTPSPHGSMESLLAGLGQTGDGVAAQTGSGLLTGGGLPDLLNQMGLDQLELSPDTASQMQYARAQFQVNIQTLQAVQTANGLEARQMSFSLNASFEYLQLSSGGDAIDPSAATGEGEAVDPMSQLLDFFSPENTAQRILDFALSFFPASSHFQEGGDTEEARQSFADYMGDAVQKGFDEALGILDQLPDPVQQDIDKTHELVFNGLDDFVTNGLDPAKMDADGIYAQIQAYQIEVQLEYQSVRAYASEPRGMDQGTQPTGTLDLQA